MPLLEAVEGDAMTTLLQAWVRDIVTPSVSRNIDQDQLRVFTLGPCSCSVRTTAEAFMNRMNPVGLGLTAAITTAVLSAACAALVAIAPGQMMAIFQSWWHGLDVTMLANTAPPVTLQSVAIGLITISAFAFVVGFLFAAIGNLVSRRLS